MKGSIETDYKVLQKLYVIWYSFGILGKSFATRLEVKQLLFPHPAFTKMKIICFRFQAIKSDLLDLLKLSNFLSLYPVAPKGKIICFSFQTIKKNWIWSNFFQRYFTILSVSVNIIGVLFFQLASLFNKLYSNF